MSNAGRWVVRILIGLVAVLVLAAGIVFVVSEAKMDKKYAFREVRIPVPSDSGSIARGGHLARLTCHGCHGDSLQGQVMFEAPMVARLVAPNILEKFNDYSDAQFAGYMRTGVRKDGISPFVMPPPGFYHLSDDDLGSIIAYVRHFPKTSATPLPASTYGLLGRLGVATGGFKTAVEEYDTTAARVGADPAYKTTRQGEYFARIICTGCHGVKLTGNPQSKAPNLSGALGYSLTEFTTLLRTGTPRNPATKLTLMGEVARRQLHNLTDEEITAVHGYLASLPAGGVPGQK